MRKKEEYEDSSITALQALGTLLAATILFGLFLWLAIAIKYSWGILWS